MAPRESRARPDRTGRWVGKRARDRWKTPAFMHFSPRGRRAPSQRFHRLYVGVVEGIEHLFGESPRKRARCPGAARPLRLFLAKHGRFCVGMPVRGAVDVKLTRFCIGPITLTVAIWARCTRSPPSTALRHSHSRLFGPLALQNPPRLASSDTGCRVLPGSVMQNLSKMTSRPGIAGRRPVKRIQLQCRVMAGARSRRGRPVAVRAPVSRCAP